MLGENGLSHGIDVNENVVNHSRECCDRWFNSIINRRENLEEGIPKVSRKGVKFVCGNCFDIDIEASQLTCKYDRIYCGAGCPNDKKDFFASLLLKMVEL